jgi:hypothetical protein
MMSVFWGGLRGGLLAASLSTLAINYFFIPPVFALNIHVDDLLRLGVFGLVALLCHWLVEKRRLTEQVLRESQAQLRLITDALPTPIAYVDASLHYCFNNQAYEDWFGVSATDLAGKHIVSVIGESAYQTIQPRLEAVLAGEPVSFEGSMPYKDGDTRYIQATYVPDFGKQGEVRGFVALVNDITQRHQAVTEAAQSAAALKEAHDQLERRVEERTAQLARMNEALQSEIESRQIAEKYLQFQANVLSQVSDVILAVDNDYRIIYWNSKAEQLYGVKAAEAIGRPRAEIYQHRWFTAEEEQATWEVLSTTGYWSGEIIHILRSGEERWIDASVSLLKDLSGQANGYLAVIRDVTERKAAEAALRESEERFRLLVDGVKDYAIFMLAPDGRIVSWNAGAERIKGYRAEEIIGQHISCLYSHQESDRKKSDQLLKIAATEGRVEDEGWRRRKDGSLFWASVVITALRDNDGNLRGFSKVTQDITLSKQAQEALLVSDAALQQLPDAILLTDLEGNIVRWMGKAEQIFGYTASEAIGKPVNFLHRKDIKERMTPQIIQAIQETGTFCGEIACLRKDGSEVPIETTAKTVYDKAGNPLFLVGINRDITLVKQAEEDRAQLIREQAARAEAEATQQRLSFLAQASTLLAASLDYEITLANVARLAVPYLADWCVLDIVEPDASLRRLAMVHPDPEKQQLMQSMHESYPEQADNSWGYPKVIQTGKSELISEVSEDLLVTVAQDAEHLEMLHQLGLKSNLCVPLITRGQVLGALTLATAESGRRYELDDQAFAEDLAKRIALAVDNARLYQQTQRALQQQAESLALIDALLAATPVGVCFFDKELRYIRINQVLADINGLSVEQHLGERFPELLPEMAALFERQLQQVLDTGEPQLNVEFWGEPPGQPGRLGCWLANYYPVRGENGQTVGLGLMVADITESKRVEQALRVAEERLRIAIKNSPMSLFNQDQELRYTWIYNPAFDHQVDEVLGKRDEDLMPLDDALVLTHIKRQVLETGVGVREEVKITQQGQDWYYDITVEPQWDAADSIVGVTCAAINISERKLAEEALRRSEERYRAFIEQSAEGIWRFELEKPLAIKIPEDDQIQHFYEYGYLAECNKFMASMYGFERPEELVGARLTDFLVRSDPHNEEYLRAFIRSHYRLSDAESYEVDRFGNPKYFSNNLVGIIENGFIVRAWGNQRDISERKQAEETLHFLAETSSILSASLDYEATLQRVAQIPVPRLADLCSVEILQDDGSIQRMAIASAHPSPAVSEATQSAAAHQLQQYYPDPNSSNPIAKVLRTGQAEVIPDIPDSLLVATIPEAEHLQLVDGLGLKSAVIVPLVARKRILGAITLVTAQVGRRYGTSDLAIAEDLARRAALAIDNARLYHVSEAARKAATTSRQSAELAARRTARLQAITAAFSEALTPTQVAEVVVNQGIAALGAMAGSVVLLAESGNSLKLAGTVGYPEGLFDDWECCPGTTATPLADTVWRGEPIFLESVEAFVTHYPNLADLPAITRSCSFAGIPLTVEGRVIGAMGLSFTDAQKFYEQDRTFMLALGQQCAQAIARAHLYEAEQSARSQAESANRIKDEFLAVLSHELRTPLNPILGWAKLLRTRKLDEVKTAHALETIERNAQLQTQLIEDLLDVSRILQGKLSLKVSPVDLATTIEAARETVRLAAEAKSIEITTIFDPTVGQVSGDSNRLQQVVWNLLTNAVKFTPTGGRVEVQLSVVSGQWSVVSGHSQQTTDNGQRTTDNYAQIIVRDTGKGIEPEFLPHVFDYFRQENSGTARVFGGLGLGLAIVRHLVELHGGTVNASSPGVGQGATFTVTLPLMNVVPNEIEDLDLPIDEPNLEGVRVLVVDDEVDTLELIVFILQQYGASVKAVNSARKAMVALATWSPEILLSDIGMPEIDGYMLIRQIRALPKEQGGEIKAIALTAYAGEADHQQILLAGFQKHITKPCVPVELATAIASLI